MTDETLIAQIKEVGAHFLTLVEEADKRNMMVRIPDKYQIVGTRKPIEVWSER